MEELSLNRQSVVSLKMEPCHSDEVPIDCDITLPDYMPEIGKILKCMSVPGISQTYLSGSRITAEGSVIVRILYLSDKNETCAYEQSVPFSKYTENIDYADAISVDCEIKTGYMNCRAISQRRIDVHGSVTLKFMMSLKHVCSLVTSLLPDEIEKRECAVSTCNCVACANRYFSVNQVETLSGNPVKSIIRATAYCLINEVKVIPDKSLVKGDMFVTVSYLTGDSCDVQTFNATLPISQIVDASGLLENEIIDTKVNVIELNVLPKADPNGEFRLLDISAKLQILMKAYLNDSFCAVRDAYSTKQVITPEISSVKLVEYSNEIKDTVVVTNTLAGGFNDVKDIWTSGITENYSFEDGILKIYGSFVISVLGESDEGPCFFEQTAEYEYKSEYTETESIFCEPHPEVYGIQTYRDPSRDNTAKIEIGINALVFKEKTEQLVTDISVGGEKTIDDGSALVIYFAKLNESVWDIARKFNSTVSDIIAQNELTDERLSEDRMLLIPR